MFVTALLAATLAAPVPKEKKEGPHFPVTLGTELVYVSGSGPNAAETVQEVTKVAERGGVYTVTLSTTLTLKGTDPVAFPPQVYDVTATTVTQLLPRRPLLDLGVKAGDEWEAEVGLPGGAKQTSTFTVGKGEEVEVPAGTFQAVPVTERQGKIKVTRWFAPGVGLVKEETDSAGVKATLALKGYTPGKAKEEKK